MDRNFGVNSGKSVSETMRGIRSRPEDLETSKLERTRGISLAVITRKSSVGISEEERESGLTEIMRFEANQEVKFRSC